MAIPLNYVTPGTGRDLSLHKTGEEGFRKAVEDFTASLSSYDRRYLQLEEKVVIVGDTQVGKSCLLQRFTKNSFTDNSALPTIGLDFVKQLYTYAGLSFTLSIWDTAGQERHQSACTNVYRGALACIGAFDLGMPMTLAHVKQWVAKVRKENEKTHINEFCIFLVGCKEDMYHTVSDTQAQNVAAELKAEYFEVSAKSGLNVKALFDRVACVLFERALVRQMDEWKKVNEQKKENNVKLTSEEDVGDEFLLGGKGIQNWKDVKKPPRRWRCCWMG
ncbi:hypothetical protein GOP47_0016980 [Adiantum capillus-veneris]|uniref:Uncharacterized protein n=1 Tax=Adiantum capillus-veneris TaxID=13818 RepID=A0A9D4ZCM5_ADICA|nr:hypothetical protein GOP47_0016980 [Adiantum capillus-veneris]